MKTLTVLFALLLAATSLAFAPQARAEILIQDAATVSGSLHQYFVAVHRPDGSCETVQVYADGLGNAMKLAREKRCISCTTEDMTRYYKAGSTGFGSPVANYCPLW